MGPISVFGVNSVAYAPATGLLGAAAMSAGVLINSSKAPASNSVVWGNNASSTGWAIRLQADASAPSTQLWNILTMGDTTAAGRTGATAPEIAGFNAWTFIVFTITDTTLSIYINGQLANTATVTALTAGPTVPTLTCDSTQLVAGAFYTESALTASTVAQLSTAVMATGDLGSVATLGTNLITSIPLQHVYSAARSSLRGTSATTWEDVGSLAATAPRPMTLTAGSAVKAVLPGLFI